eukprot:6775265-Prymnesium_polylepis.1
MRGEALQFCTFSTRILRARIRRIPMVRYAALPLYYMPRPGRGRDAAARLSAAFGFSQSGKTLDFEAAWQRLS